MEYYELDRENTESKEIEPEYALSIRDTRGNVFIINCFSIAVHSALKALINGHTDCDIQLDIKDIADAQIKCQTEFYRN